MQCLCEVKCDVIPCDRVFNIVLISQETLIVWSENDTTELALSFQERAGCDEIWAKICQVSLVFGLLFTQFCFHGRRVHSCILPAKKREN